jgi:glycosyltransferase involved in cell wall biosynthesis
MRIFLWHVHGSWTTAFVQGSHQYLVPVVPGRGPEGRGRARTWDWPRSVVEVSLEQARLEAVDAVILQRPEEAYGWTEKWLGRRPGKDLPAIYVEHNAPQGRVAEMRHPMADRPELTLAHVTHFNRLLWDSGATPTRVIEHGVVDPGHLYTGEMDRAVAAVNEPLRRGRVTGTDLLPWARSVVPVDLFGMGTEALGGTHLTQDRLHREMARRRAYLHLPRWTSLGLTLIEAMFLGMPVVALAMTEAPEAIPAGAGIVSNRPEVLAEGLRRLIGDPEEATMMGKAARAAALARFELERFLHDWDQLLEEVVG